MAISISAELQPQTDLLSKLQNMGESIPGLDVDAIIKNMADKSKEIRTHYLLIANEIQENVDRGMTEKQAQSEAKSKANEVLTTFKDNIRSLVNEKITDIKHQYKIFKDGIESIPADVKSAIANITLPPSVSVPPAAPNPIWALNLAQQTKNALVKTLDIVVVAFTEIIKAANTIMFQIPQSILSLFESIAVVSKLINTIPG